MANTADRPFDNLPIPAPALREKLPEHMPGQRNIAEPVPAAHVSPRPTTRMSSVGADSENNSLRGCPGCAGAYRPNPDKSMRMTT